MKSLDEWINQKEIKDLKNKEPDKLFTVDFNRDPNRAIHYDPLCFYSPADGFILYSKIVEPKEEIIEVKGEQYTIDDLIKEEVDQRCLIIGIFMTGYDVHVNRVPTNGFLKYEQLEPLKVENLSMRAIETEILKQLEIDSNDMKYAIYNERFKNRIYYPMINQHYYLIQIADYEVDVISHFDDQNKYYTQGERFSVVRMGSQCDLIIPFINPDIEFKSLVDDKILFHLEGGMDELVKIVKRGKK